MPELYGPLRSFFGEGRRTSEIVSVKGLEKQADKSIDGETDGTE